MNKVKVTITAWCELDDSDTIPTQDEAMQICQETLADDEFCKRVKVEFAPEFGEPIVAEKERS